MGRLAEIREIYVFPVKSLAGIAQSEALVEPWGLSHDRRWLVVDPSGRFVTQRIHSGMARIRTAMTPDGLALSMPGREPIAVEIPGPAAPLLTVTVWRTTLPARAADAAANAWISAALGQDLRLAHMHDTAARPVHPAYAGAGRTVSFADGYPVLLTAMASLADLNARLTRPVPISRFRGNVVIDGAKPWEEDGWRLIRMGEAVFRVVKPCDRCIVTTIDQQTGERPDRTEPLKTLGAFRHDERGIMFGQNLIPEIPARIRVGDPIEILERGPSNVTPIPEA